MEQQIYDESFKSVKITFGSCLTLSLADMQYCFVQSDGFLQSKLDLKNFKRAIGNRQHDFQNCVFKILPPIDNKSQQKLLEVLDAKKFHQLNLNQRKTLILELQQNLDGEINSNMSTQNKLNGTPVIFSTSSFHLIHLASMKFVSLTKDKSDSYIFTLTDYPNEKSLFKFLPCLSLQKQRSNIVMNKDVVQVCCTGLVHSRKGYLYTNYSNKKNGKEFEVQQLKIYANLENPCRWVVNSYSQCEQAGEQSFISIGNVISLDLSDRNFCLSASKASDPFENLCQQRERQMAYDNLGASFMQKEGNSFQYGAQARRRGVQKNNSSSFLVVQSNQNNNQNYLKDPSEYNTPAYPSQHNIQPVKLIPQTTASQIEDYQISNNQQFFHNQMLDVSNDHQNLNPSKLKPGASNTQTFENNNDRNQNDFFKINQNLSSEEQRQYETEEQELREIKEQLQNENHVFFEQAINEQTLSSSKEQSILFAFWKIEPIFMYNGGYIKWNEVYRLKHFITGKYLTVKIFQNPKANPNEGVDTFVYPDLTEQDDLGTHFQFVPISQQKTSEQSKMVMKESFYRLQNVQTKLYVGFKDEPFEEGEIEQFQQRRTPFLEQDESKISIFKMRIVNFEEMWETNFILYSMQFLMNQLKNLNLLKYKSEEQKWKYRVYFRQVLQEVNDAIIGIDSYINNQITSFIDVQQEYSKPSPKRQKIIREQHMIGMLCWILKIIFPQYKEFHKIAPSQQERMDLLKIYKSTNWPIIKEYDLSTEKQRQMSILKFEEEVFAKSYRISFQVYKLLESVCSNNVVNQEYLTRFFKIIVSHIGYGDFICQSIQKIFQNAQILQDLVKKRIEDSNEQTNQGSYRNYGYAGVLNDYLLANNRSFNNNKLNNSSSDNENSFEKRNGLSFFQGQKTFLKEIIDKFQMFEAYILPELIQLLSNFCVVNNNALYIIQEYIFNLIFTDKQLTRFCLIPIEMVPKDSDNLKDLKIQNLQTSKDNIQQDMESLVNQINNDKQDENIEKQIIYLQQQLILMANLCKDRNFKACNEFSQIFPLSILVQFIIDQNKNKNIQLLAGFLKIIMNIYIDKYPNQKQTRPNLVRIVNLEALKSITNIQNNPAADGDLSVDAKRNINNLMSTGSAIRNNLNGRKQSYHFTNRMRQKSIKYNVEEKYNVNKPFLLNGAQQNNQQDFQYQLQLTKLKDQLLKHLEEQVKILQNQEKSNKNESQQGKKAQVYNVFMLELIHTLTTMLQFGILHERTGLKQQKQQKDKLSFLAYFQILKQDQKQEVSELERIISSLAVLLEYDEIYFQELDSLHVRRKYVQHQRAKRDNVYAKVLNQTKTITNILSKNDDKNKEKQKLYNNNLDFESDIIKDPIFKKFQGLKKILFQYTNKTFSVREKNEHIDIEEQIKIKICEFFSFLLDMRQDFFIDNIISYFQQKFCEYKKEETVKVIDDVLELLPNNFTEVGHVVKSEKVKIYTQRYRIQSIDEVLDRPFMECLLVSFYFAQSGELENKIMELLQRCITQKNEVFNNLLKLELIFSKQHQELYNILNEIFIELKNIVSDSQTWLNLENDDDYNYVKTEDLIVRTVKIFKNQQDKENLAVIQSIFKHIGGHQCLIDLIDKGLNVIENSGFYIQNLDNLQTNEQWDAQELFEKLISILKNSFQALSAYCLDNKENQEFMYKKFFKNLISQKKHNIGQIEFINDLFRDNYELSINVQFQDLQYFIQMIKLHGKQYQFLEIFQILLNNVEQKQDFYVLQNLLLNLFFDEIIFQTISPFAKKETGVTFFQTDYFFDNKIDEQKYKSIFTILISRLMSDEMEQSQIMKVSYFIPALELLKYLRERTVSYRQMNIKDIQVIEQNIKVNAAIIELILFLSSSKEFAQTLPQNTKLIVEIVEFETMKLERAQTYSESYKFYLIDNLLPLINYYSENYLKDLLFSENSNEVDQRKKLYKFAYTFINSLDKVLNFKQEELLENDRGKQLRVLTKHYDFQIPFNIMGEKNNLDSNSDKFYELNDDDEIQLLPNKNRLKKKSFKTIINEEKPKETKSKKQKDQTVRNINMIEYWLHFKKKLQEDARFKSILKDEKKILCQSILKIQNMFQTPNQQQKRDIILTSDDILSKILKFIEFWRQKNVPMKSVIFVMKIMNYIIKNAFSIQEEDENLMDVFKQSSQKIQKNEQNKIRQERQDQLDRLNSSKIVIMLIWEECENNAEYLNSLFKFMNLMLKGGNVSVQKTIYEYFLGSQASEKFFAKVSRIFQAQITKNSMFGRKNSEKMILKILKLFQLLCLNHNQDLQNYMRKQFSNKNSYDLVSTTVKLLISYRVSKETYKTIKQCFNTLTEFVQGPCLENQDTITNTKFLEYALQILSEDEKLFLKTDVQQDERQRQLLLLQNEQTNRNSLNQNDETNLETVMNKQKKNQSKKLHFQQTDQPTTSNALSKNPEINADSQREYDFTKADDYKQQKPNKNKQINLLRQQTVDIDQISEEKQSKEESVKYEEYLRQQKFQIHLGELARLKYKCLLTIISILECNYSKKDLISKIMRIIPVSVLTKNLTRVYQLYKKHFKKQDYNIYLFQKMKAQIDYNKPPDYYEFVIENGFLVYMLIQLYIQNNVLIETDEEDEDMTSVLNEFKKQEENIFTEMLKEKDNIFSNMMKFGRDLINVGKNAINEIKENAYKFGVIQLNKTEQQEKERLEKKELIKNALIFFKNKTCSIEIVRNGCLQTISFPKMPLCFTLSDEIKDDFRINVNISSHKEKLSYLIDQSGKIIDKITHEENVRLIVEEYKFVGIFVMYNHLWQRISFYLALAINALIIASYSDTTFVYDSELSAEKNKSNLEYARRQQPRFFYDTYYDNTENLIILLGTISSILISVIVSFFILKRAPLILGSVWYGFLSSSLPIWKKSIFFILKSIYSIYLLVQDFDIIYYLFQLFFVMLGLFAHPFYFCGLLIDMLRFNVLSNVFHAIYDPKLELGLTLLLFAIVQYYFTIFAYLIFYNHYIHQECQTFWQCYLKNFDYTFKSVGALGHFLYEPQTLSEVGGDTSKYLGVNQNYKDKYFSRFFFDNIFHFVLAHVIIYIFGGIIIDKYRQLKDANNRKQQDEKKNCFICGFDRQTLDKGDDILGFYYHIRQEHYMWNYIFYMAYLQLKDKVMYNGDEMYIFKKIEKNDISWIPKKRTKRIIDDQEIEEEKLKYVKQINQTMKQLNEQIEKITQKQKLIIKKQVSQEVFDIMDQQKAQQQQQPQ